MAASFRGRKGRLLKEKAPDGGCQGFFSFEMASEQFPPSEASLSQRHHARIVEQKTALALSPKKGSLTLDLVRLNTEGRHMKKPRKGGGRGFSVPFWGTVMGGNHHQ